MLFYLFEQTSCAFKIIYPAGLFKQDKGGEAKVKLTRVVLKIASWGPRGGGGRRPSQDR